MIDKPDRAIVSVFGEEALTDEFWAGRAAYEKDRLDRDSAGDPLPPGGCLLLGIEAVIASSLVEVHRLISIELGVPLRDVRLSPRRVGESINLGIEVGVPVDDELFDSIRSEASALFNEISGERLALLDPVGLG